VQYFVLLRQHFASSLVSSKGVYAWRNVRGAEGLGHQGLSVILTSRSSICACMGGTRGGQHEAGSLRVVAMLLRPEMMFGRVGHKETATRSTSVLRGGRIRGKKGNRPTLLHQRQKTLRKNQTNAPCEPAQRRGSGITSCRKQLSKRCELVNYSNRCIEVSRATTT
jgi:hypothetical protein